MTYPDWLLKPCGTDAAVRRHYRRGEPLDDRCKKAEHRHTAAQYARAVEDGLITFAVHADHGGKPRCGHRTAHVIAGPGQEVTCKRCILLAEMARAA